MNPIDTPASFPSRGGRRATASGLGVAIQGEPGSFSDAAARALLGAPQITCCETFDDVAQSVASGSTPYGVLPVSNSLAGQVIDLKMVLARHGLVDAREVLLPIRQCLIAGREIALKDVREVHSHPMALRQCRGFLERHPWMTAVEVTDTAGAVRQVCGAGRDDLAAIAGKEAARLYGGFVLVEGIADRPDNITRFVLIRSRRSLDT